MRFRKAEGVAVSLSLLTVLLGGFPMLAAEEIVFKDVRQQSRQFIEWYQTIKLTPEQEAVKKAALGPMPANCCHQSSAYTCCCECNISRTIWGLSNYMIAEQGAKSEKVRDKVQEWVHFTNPNGYSGQSCYTGGCERPFAQDGCGGMNADRLVF